MKQFYKGYSGLRKKGFDYSSPGFYFITIDCHRREWHFGHILRQQMILSPFGEILLANWLQLPLRYGHIKLHTYQIMPDHFHAIIEIISGDTHSASPEDLSAIIGGFKSLVSNQCLQAHKEKYYGYPVIPFLGKIWQRSFFDRIFYDKASFNSISRYIRNNPKKWNRR